MNYSVLSSQNQSTKRYCCSTRKMLLLVFMLIPSFNLMAQAHKTPFKPADVYHIANLSDAEISPDGRWVIYVLSEIDSAKDERVRHLWMQSLDGKVSLQLTYGAETASNPHWSPDGKYISFLSDRESKNGSQVWLMDRRGGEGRKITDINGDIDQYSWSPNSAKLLLTIKDPESKATEAPRPPLQITRYHFKQDVKGYLQNRRTHLYVFDIAGKKTDTLTTGSTDESGAQWSPDGAKIAFVSNHSADADKNDNDDIFVMEARAHAKPVQLTTWAGHDNNPKWSPDGRQIAYLRSTSNATYMMYDQDILCLMNADGTANQLLTERLDRPVSNICWSRDGAAIAYIVDDDRLKYAAGLDLKNKAQTDILKGKFAVNDIYAGPGGGWVVQMSTPYLPNELYTVKSGSHERLTWHQDWVNKVNLAHVENFSSKSQDGTIVSGLVYTPDSVNRKKLPLILYIHGGPVHQDDYSFDTDRQLLACAGYTVIGVNYRGSLGRGLNYSKVIYADWGNKEVKDLLGAVDEMVKQGLGDPNRLGVGGWSYGGLLTDYVVASDTRFKAAVSGGGSGSQVAMYGTDEYIQQWDNEIGQPWKSQDKYIKLSYPFFHADKINTPILFMSGLNDFNVPVSGAEQMYQALKSQDKPTELIIYPNSYHRIKRPSYDVDKYQRYIDWFNKYLK